MTIFYLKTMAMTMAINTLRQKSAEKANRQM